MASRNIIGVGILLALITSPALGQHKIILKSGEQVIGEIQVSSIKLKTGVGAMDVPLNEINTIQGTNITLGDGTFLKGTIVDRAFPVKTRFGSINVRTQDIKDMVLNAPGGPEGQLATTRQGAAPAARSGPTEQQVASQRKQGSFMSPTTITSRVGQTVEQAQTELANGPKKRVAIGRFENKTAIASQGQYNIGSGMSDMLTTALVNTGRFIVLERDQMNSVMNEQNFGATGRVRGATAARIGEVEGAELLIFASVTDYMADQSGVQGQVGSNAGMGVGAIFGPIGMLVGAVAGGLAASGGAQKAHVSIDLRLVDAQTGRVVSATSIQGTPKSIGAEISFGGFGGSAFTKTPIGMAIRDCINNAVNWMLITSFPQEKEKFLAAAAAAEAAETAAAAAKAAPGQQAANETTPSEANTDAAKPSEGIGGFFSRIFSGDKK